VARRPQASKAGGVDVLPAASLPHDAVLLGLRVDQLGQVSVASDVLHLGVVLELLLQPLVVVGRLPLSVGEL